MRLNFYMSPVWFPDESKLLIFRHDYSTSFGTGSMDYRLSVNHGDLTGSGSSASYTSTSHVVGTVSGGFASSGTVNYYPDLKRAVWTDGRTVETFSMNGGLLVLAIPARCRRKTSAALAAEHTVST